MKKQKYVTAIALTSLIFVIGIMIGSKITDENTNRLQQQVQKDSLEMQGLDLEMSIVSSINKSSLCGYIDFRLPEIVREKVDLGRKFDLQDIPSEQAESLKKQYLISLVKYWLFSEVNREQCGIKSPQIVFFFDDSEVSREQGRVLDYLVYRSNESITVFTFNTMWEEPLTKLLMINYNVTSTPTVVVDNSKYEGLQSREALSGILCGKYNLTFC